MRQNFFKLAVLILMLSIGFVTVRSFGIDRLTPAAFRDFMLSFGTWAPLLYIFLYTVRPLFLFPASLLSISGGITFGPWWGTLYDLIGASLGAYLSFGLSRALGRGTVEKWFGRRIHKLDNFVAENGFRTILFLRLIPMLSFDAISYGGGLSKIRFCHFAPATTIGMIPGTFTFNFLGHSLHDVFSPTFYVAVGLVLLLVLLPVIHKSFKGRRHKDVV